MKTRKIVLDEESYIEVKDPLELLQVENESIDEFSKFVYHVYVRDYTTRYNWEPDEESLNSMIEEDKKYSDYSVYVVCSTKEAGILGTFKITKRQKDIRFPIETEFGIELDELISSLGLEVNDIWHFGRLAVDKDKLKQYNISTSSAEILTRLLITSIHMVCESNNNLIITEVDHKVLRLMFKMGFNLEMMGKPRYYLGSMTYPAIVYAKDLLEWISEYKKAIAKNRNLDQESLSKVS